MPNGRKTNSLAANRKINVRKKNGVLGRHRLGPVEDSEMKDGIQDETS